MIRLSRDEKLFDSANYSPFQTFGGQDFYPTLIEKAARLDKKSPVP